MKKVLSFVLALCLIIPCAFVFAACDKDKDPTNPPAAVTTWADEAGTVSEAVSGIITIETAEELAGVAKKVNEGTTYEGVVIRLANDIDLKNKEWTPIGYGSSHYDGSAESGKAFKGIFDGNGKTISNLKITKFVGGGVESTTSTSGVGLFGQTIGATIANVFIDGAYVKGNHYVGVVAGWTLNTEFGGVIVKDAIVDCTYANDDESGDKAGIIVGHLADGGVHLAGVAAMEFCAAIDCDVYADRDAGQLIGCLANGATQTYNMASNVEVDWNASGSTPNKSNTNIKNEIVGRVA